jgi:hypothetical protein
MTGEDTEYRRTPQNDRPPNPKQVKDRYPKTKEKICPLVWASDWLLASGSHNFRPSFQLQKEELLASKGHFETPPSISEDTLIICSRTNKSEQRRDSSCRLFLISQLSRGKSVVT